jgi:hypothetical protein
MFRREFHLVPLNEFESNFQRGTTLEVIRLISFWRASVHLREAQPELPSDLINSPPYSTCH